jgi:hypothetical protein
MEPNRIRDAILRGVWVYGYAAIVQLFLFIRAIEQAGRPSR